MHKKYYFSKIKIFILLLSFSTEHVYAEQTLKDNLFYCAIGAASLLILQQIKVTNLLSLLSDNLLNNQCITLTNIYILCTSIWKTEKTKNLDISRKLTSRYDKSFSVNIDQPTATKVDALKKFLLPYIKVFEWNPSNQIVTSLIHYEDFDTLIGLLKINPPVISLQNEDLRHIVKQMHSSPEKKDFYLNNIKKLISADSSEISGLRFIGKTHILKYARQHGFPYDFITFLMNCPKVQFYYKFFIACSSGDIHTLQSMLNFLLCNESKKLNDDTYSVGLNINKANSSDHVILGIVPKDTISIIYYKLLAWACQNDYNEAMIQFLWQHMSQYAQKKALPYAFYQAIKNDCQANISLLQNLAQSHTLEENFFAKILLRACGKLLPQNKEVFKRQIHFFVAQSSTNLFAPGITYSYLTLLGNCYFNCYHKPATLLEIFNKNESKFQNFFNKQLQAAAQIYEFALPFQIPEISTFINFCISHGASLSYSSQEVCKPFDYAKKRYLAEKKEYLSLLPGNSLPNQDKENNDQSFDPKYKKLMSASGNQPNSIHDNTCCDMRNQCKHRIHNHQYLRIFKQRRDLFLTEFITIGELSHMFIKQKNLPKEIAQHIIYYHIKNNIGTYIKLTLKGIDSELIKYYDQSKEEKTKSKAIILNTLINQNSSLENIINTFQQKKQLAATIQQSFK